MIEFKQTKMAKCNRLGYICYNTTSDQFTDHLCVLCLCTYTFHLTVTCYIATYFIFTKLLGTYYIFFNYLNNFKLMLCPIRAREEKLGTSKNVVEIFIIRYLQ